MKTTIFGHRKVNIRESIGPLLLCPTIQPLLRSLSITLVMVFKVDITLGNPQSTLAASVYLIVTKGS
jgi:hypothetical protein